MRTRALVLPAVLMVTATAAFAQETVSLKRTYKAGDKDLYQTVFTIDNGSQKVKLTILVSELIKEVAPDGKVVVASTMEAGRVELGEDAQPVPGVGETVTTTMDKNGKLIKRETGEKSAGMFSGLMSAATVGQAPDRPLKLGEVWPVEIPLSADRKQKVAGTLTLVGREPKSDEVAVETFKVKGVADGNFKSDEGDQKVHLDVMTYLEPGTGKYLKTEGKVEGLKVPLLGTSTVTFKRLRIEPGKQPVAPAPSSAH